MVRRLDLGTLPLEELNMAKRITNPAPHLERRRWHTRDGDGHIRADAEDVLVVTLASGGRQFARVTILTGLHEGYPMHRVDVMDADPSALNAITKLVGKIKPHSADPACAVNVIEHYADELHRIHYPAPFGSVMHAARAMHLALCANGNESKNGPVPCAPPKPISDVKTSPKAKAKPHRKPISVQARADKKARSKTKGKPKAKKTTKRTTTKRRKS